MRETYANCGRSVEFATTHWSVVLCAAEGAAPSGQAALEQLCRSYWYPLYAYVRRQGHATEDAQDLTQMFFARLIEKDYLSHARRERGRFRTFLLTSLKRFLVNEWEKSLAVRRGNGQRVMHWEMDESEGRYRSEPVDETTPEKLFEKRWAATLLDRVLSLLQDEFTQGGKAEQFDQLKVLLWGDKGPAPYSEVAARLRMTEGALKVAVHRLRQRFRELLRAEVAHTVAAPGEVDDELRHLIAVISE